MHGLKDVKGRGVVGQRMLIDPWMDACFDANHHAVILEP